MVFADGVEESEEKEDSKSISLTGKDAIIICLIIVAVSLLYWNFTVTSQYNGMVDVYNSCQNILANMTCVGKGGLL